MLINLTCEVCGVTYCGNITADTDICPDCAAHLAQCEAERAAAVRKDAEKLKEQDREETKP